MIKNAASVKDIIAVFNGLFEDSLHTRLVKADDEPIYLPASKTGKFNEIHFAHGFINSALHETAHWCIAGAKRLELVDYGYWYAPDGRSAAEQKEFEKVEVRPQALEWIFAVACGVKFHISVDNLIGLGAGSSDSFKKNVYFQSKRYLEEGLPERAEIFLDALSVFYGTDRPRSEQFELAML